jgi:carboxyl-terminal processing protease
MLQAPRQILRALTGATLLLALGCATPAPSTSGTPISSEQARESFEMAWKTVDAGDADPAHGGVDWHAARERFAPRAEACTTRESLRAVIAEMLATLGRSHFGVVAHRESDRIERSEGDGSFGIDLRVIEDELVVTSVRADSPAARAGVQRGWRVLRVRGAIPLEAHGDDGTFARYARDAAARSLDQGPAGSRETWLFAGASSEPAEIELEREPLRGRRTRLGVLPEFSVACSGERIGASELRALGVPEELRIGVIAFNVWMPALSPDLDAAVDRLRDCDGIVIDLRGNPGGVAAMAMGFAGHFHDAPDSLGTMRTRETTLEFRINPRRSTPDGRTVRPFAGPVAILVDPLSASTSEIFAAGLRSLGRARVIGRGSAGAALPAQMRRLPSGDALMFAFADFTLPDGDVIEGVGVVPDEASGERVSDWRDGCDPDLRAASRWISRTLRDLDCHE